MKATVLFPAWLPDQPPHLLDGLVTARNVYAGPNGYAPVKDFNDVTSAMPGTYKGGAAFVGTDGSTLTLAGTDTNLYRYQPSGWTSVITGASLGSGDRWKFAQFGDLAIAVNGGAPQKVDLITGVGAALGGSPPTADMVAIVRDFVVLGRAGGDQTMIQWSAFNDAEGWTPATDQSGFQPMLTGGAVMGLAGGEYGIILQRNRIVRMTYTADEFTFQFDEISSNVGCDAVGSVIQHGRLVFFHSDRGFMMCDGTDVKPLGNEKVDRTFLAAYARADFTSMSAAVDPVRTLVMWAMPGRIWVYNWALDRWSDIVTNVAALLEGFTFNLDMDTDDPEDANDNDIDSASPSLDDSRYAGGDPLLLVVTPGNVLGTFSGANMNAVIALPFTELVKGREARTRLCRPLSDVTDNLTLVLDARSRLGDAPNESRFSTITGDGTINIRTAARYHAARLEYEAGAEWTYAQGLEFDCEMGGNRTVVAERRRVFA